MGALADRKALLERKLAARDGVSGFKANVIALRAEIERLDAAIASGEDG
jgi:hypothetical protein